MSDWTKTGTGDIEITTGDSTYLIDEEQEEYHKEVGHYTELCKNLSRGEEEQFAKWGYIFSGEECKVWVSVSTDKNWNYVHFSYDGGTGYSLRRPRYVKDANT
tara:strand:+ start:879 stop:1187 length:309 start_codon:yes stop_codon:yes gene_type:complete